MLTTFRTLNARVAHLSIARPFYAAPRLFRAVPGRLCYAAAARAFHVATGEFTDLRPDGALVTKEVSIRIGDPGEAYVLIPTEIGYALQAGSRLTHEPLPLPKRPDRFPLSFFHEIQSFALGNSVRYHVVYLLLIFQLSDSSPSCPRLVIPQQLPRQSEANTSPATLYIYGVMHTIALDNTPDGIQASILVLSTN